MNSLKSKIITSSQYLSQLRLLSNSHEFKIEFDKTLSHVPVMVNQLTKSLVTKPDGIYLDMTFGAGGHSKNLLENYPELQLYSLDRDPSTMAHSNKLLQKYPERYHPMIGKFRY